MMREKNEGGNVTERKVRRTGRSNFLALWLPPIVFDVISRTNLLSFLTFNYLAKK